MCSYFYYSFSYFYLYRYFSLYLSSISVFDVLFRLLPCPLMIGAFSMISFFLNFIFYTVVLSYMILFRLFYIFRFSYSMIVFFSQLIWFIYFLWFFIIYLVSYSNCSDRFVVPKNIVDLSCTPSTAADNFFSYFYIYFELFFIIFLPYNIWLFSYPIFLWNFI